jgi:hypothetical protein
MASLFLIVIVDSDMNIPGWRRRVTFFRIFFDQDRRSSRSF